MDVSKVLAEKVKEQIGGLTFELLRRDAEIQVLLEENTALKDALKQLAPKEDTKE